MIIGMDLDGVIAKQNGGWTAEYYKTCSPDHKVIDLMKKLDNDGNKIIIYTSRLEYDAKMETMKWLKKHDVPFTAIHFDKPLYDFMVDDKNINIEQLTKLAMKDPI